jgi:hypothetical protein
MSVKKGFPPITRYHATDCAALKKEFSEKNGWNIHRQIKYTGRLCEIVGASRAAIGIVIGARCEDIRKFIAVNNTPEAALQDLCFRMALVSFSGVLREYFPGDKMKIVYDQSKEFGAQTQRSFNTFVDGTTAGVIEDCFTDAKPDDSRTCVPLQVADFIAYEGFKRIDGVRRGKDELRKSLNALLGTKFPLLIDQFTDETFQDMVRMIDNRQAGRPVADGVNSKLKQLVKTRTDLVLRT